MSFIDEIKERAKNELKTIVLPESEDVRVLKATEIINKEKFAKIILIGDKKKVEETAKKNSIDISNTKIINPKTSEKYNEFVNLFYELRKHKGMTIEKSKELMLDNVYFGMMMVKSGEADGLVSGAIHSTADTLRPALQILKTAPSTKLVSAFFVMVVPDCSYGENGTFIFSDAGLNQDPNSEELSEIAQRIMPTPASEASAERSISLQRSIILAKRNKAHRDLVRSREILMQASRSNIAALPQKRIFDMIKVMDTPSPTISDEREIARSKR